MSRAVESTEGMKQKKAIGLDSPRMAMGSIICAWWQRGAWWGAGDPAIAGQEQRVGGVENLGEGFLLERKRDERRSGGKKWVWRGSRAKAGYFWKKDLVCGGQYVLWICRVQSCLGFRPCFSADTPQEPAWTKSLPTQRTLRLASGMTAGWWQGVDT